MNRVNIKASAFVIVDKTNMINLEREFWVQCPALAAFFVLSSKVFYLLASMCRATFNVASSYNVGSAVTVE